MPLSSLASLATRRRAWRTARWLLAGASLPLFWACTARTVTGVGHCPSTVETNRFQTSVNPKLDILFMVDNSSSMSPLQAKLLDKKAGFPVFMEVLKGIPVGDGSGATALPDIHVAVVSSDVGPGGLDLSGSMKRMDAPPACGMFGDMGRFQTTPRLPCATSPLPPDQHFLASSNNQAVKNYEGDITDAFTCIAKLGELGCGFEAQLKSVRWALDPSLAPAENNGFLRDDAYLAVILITNEDDCSMPDDSTLMELDQEHNTDALGPLLFRCNEYGHLCNIDGTLQPPPRQASSNLMECISNDTDTGRLTKVSDEVAFLKGLKPGDPGHILVAAITGPAMPYDVAMVPQILSDHTTESQPTVQHSCTQGDEYADPSIRIQQWVEAFGDHGVLQSICADTFEPALRAIANQIIQIIEPPCIETTYTTRPSGAPDCAVSDRVKNDGGKIVETALPSCLENGNAAPCWSLEDDGPGGKCAGKKVLKVSRPAGELPSNRSTEISCVRANNDVAATQATAPTSACPN